MVVKHHDNPICSQLHREPCKRFTGHYIPPSAPLAVKALTNSFVEAALISAQIELIERVLRDQRHHLRSLIL